MSNPVLNDSAFERAANGWAAPKASTSHQSPAASYQPPISDGPTSPWPAPAGHGGATAANVMTINGTITATATLMVVLLAAAAVGWTMASPAILGMPLIASVIVAIGVSLVIAFKPHLAKFLAPLYAIAQGFAVGAISRVYDSAFDGIVLQAVGATAAVFFTMLFLYRMRIIKVTEKFRSVIMTATIGIMVFYGISFVVSLFTKTSLTGMFGSGLLGIGISVVVSIVAALNLLLDFDFIERGAARRLDKGFEWYAAHGLVVTIVWLYLEMLRLLAKLRNN